MAAHGEHVLEEVHRLVRGLAAVAEDTPDTVVVCPALWEALLAEARFDTVRGEQATVGGLTVRQSGFLKRGFVLFKNGLLLRAYL